MSTPGSRAPARASGLRRSGCPRTTCTEQWWCYLPRSGRSAPRRSRKPGSWSTACDRDRVLRAPAQHNAPISCAGWLPCFKRQQLPLQGAAGQPRRRDEPWASFVVAWPSSTERTMTASTIEKHTPGPTKHSLHQTTGTLAGKRTPRLLLRVRLTSVDVIRAVFHRPAWAARPGACGGLSIGFEGIYPLSLTEILSDRLKNCEPPDISGF
eukprot:COSAG03_NODE_368_length_8526_cov_6.102053_8_plen_210_part_00